MCVHISTHTHIYMYIFIYTSIGLSKYCRCISIVVHMCTLIQTIDICMYTHMYIYIYIYINIYTYISRTAVYKRIISVEYPSYRKGIHKCGRKVLYVLALHHLGVHTFICLCGQPILGLRGHLLWVRA